MKYLNKNYRNLILLMIDCMKLITILLKHYNLQIIFIFVIML